MDPGTAQADNARLARAALDAIAQEDQRALSALLHAPWFAHKASPLVFDELRVHATDICAIVEVRNHATMKDGTLYQGEAVVIFEMRDGKIAEIREYLNPVLFNQAVPPGGAASQA